MKKKSTHLKSKLFLKRTSFLIFALALLLSNQIYSQEMITVNAKSNPSYRVFHTSKALDRLLFIKTKGNLIIPGLGYFLDVDKEASNKLGVETIAYIPLNGETYYEDEIKNAQINIIKLSKNDKNLYFSPPNSYRKTDITKNFFNSPTLKDTLDWYEFTNYENKEFTKEWIEMLDSNSSIIIKSTHYAKTTSGGESFVTYEKTKMSDLAKLKLSSLKHLFPETNEDWNKKQWQSWFENIINYQEKTVADCNTEVWNMERYFNPNYKFTSKYYTDKTTNFIGIIESLPFYDDYANQQFVFFNQKLGKTFIYDIHTDENPFRESINHFVFDNNKLYFFTESMKWAKFEYNKEKDAYQNTEIKNFLPSDFLKKNERIDIMNSYSNANISYLLFTKNKQQISEYYVASINTQNGNLIAIKSISTILKESKIPNWEKCNFEHFKYCNFDQDYFVIGLNNSEKKQSYILKMNQNLEKNAAIQSQIYFNWYEHILTTDNEIVHLRFENNTLQRYFYKNDLSKFNENLDSKIESNLYLMDNCYLVKDGNNIRMFIDYEDTYTNGIIQEKINIKGKTFEETCAFIDLPIEEIDSDNQKVLFYASPNNKGTFTLFMKDDDVLRFVNVK